MTIHEYINEPTIIELLENYGEWDLLQTPTDAERAGLLRFFSMDANDDASEVLQ